MANGNSIIARLLKRVMHLLLPGIKHDLHYGVKTVYEAIVDLWNAVIETQTVVNKNAEEMEIFSAEMKAWAEEWEDNFDSSFGDRMKGLVEVLPDGTRLLVIGSDRYRLNLYADNVEKQYSGLTIESTHVSTTISNGGGNITLDFSAKVIETIIYSEDNQVNNVLPLGASGILVEITEGGSYASLSGNKITFSQNNTTESRTVKVTATITAHGMTATKTITFTQSGYVEPVYFYAGCMNGNIREFAQKTDGELADAASKIDFNSGSTASGMIGSTNVAGCKKISVGTTDVIFYVMVPSELSFMAARLITTSLNTDFSAEDLLDEDTWGARHETVTIGGKSYSLYGIMNAAFPSSVDNKMEIYLKKN